LLIHHSTVSSNFPVPSHSHYIVFMV
jgi:hypothetical protein